MPILASFEGVDRIIYLAIVLFVIWASSAIAAPIAFALAFSERQRRASRRFAIASIIGSAPISVFAAIAVFFGPTRPFFLLGFVPWIIGTGVLCLGRRYTYDKFDIMGTVAYKNSEGGFFAIDGDDGSRYDPISLPESFRKDGLRVKVTARLRQHGMSIHLYGPIIEVVSITRQEKEQKESGCYLQTTS